MRPFKGSEQATPFYSKPAIRTGGTSSRAASHNDRLCALPARRPHGRVPPQEQVAAQLQRWGGGGTYPAVFQQNGKRSHQAARAPQEKVTEQRRQLLLAK